MTFFCFFFFNSQTERKKNPTHVSLHFIKQNQRKKKGEVGAWRKGLNDVEKQKPCMKVGVE